MRKPKTKLKVVLVLVGLAMTSVTTARVIKTRSVTVLEGPITTGQDKSKANGRVVAVQRRQDQVGSAPNQFEITLAQLPTVDYSTPDLPDPKERAKRQAKSKRYDKHSSQQIQDSPKVSGRVVSLNWTQGVSAI